MTYRSAPFLKRTRLAACLAAAGLLFATAAPAQTQLPPPAYGNAQARQDRIEALEQQLIEATAENERLQFELREAQREIQRLRNMVGELAGVNQSLSTAPPEGENGANGARPPERRSDVAPEGLNPAQRAHTGTLGSMPADAAPPPPPSADEAYENAQRQLASGRYAQAETAFAEFLQQHPNASQAADARFWLAYTLLARNDYQNAAANFVQYLQNSPNGGRAPEAQVRLGMALAGMAQDGRNDEADLRQACGAFASLTRRYPNAPRNVRALATREARAANCT